MIDLEPIILEAQQAKASDCFANVEPQTLIELCAELKALRALPTNLSGVTFGAAGALGFGIVSDPHCVSRAYCYYGQNYAAGISGTPCPAHLASTFPGSTKP